MFETLCRSVKATAPVKACFPKKTNGKQGQQIEGQHTRAWQGIHWQLLQKGRRSRNQLGFSNLQEKAGKRMPFLLLKFWKPFFALGSTIFVTFCFYGRGMCNLTCRNVQHWRPKTTGSRLVGKVFTQPCLAFDGSTAYESYVFVLFMVS